MRRWFPLLLLWFVAMPAGGAPDPSAGATRAPSGGSLRLVPVSPIGVKGPSDTCESAACRALLELIDGAERKIDFAVYGLRHQNAILDALVRAKKRGVALRGIVDKDDEDKTYYSDTDELIKRIQTVRTDHVHDRMKAEGAPRYDASQDRCERPEGFLGPLQCLGYDLGDKCLIAAHASHEELSYDGDIMHDKFFVVDERWVWTGSANISDSDITGFSANLVVVLDSTDVAAQYTREMDQMYDQSKFHQDKSGHVPTTVTLGEDRVAVWFPPQGDAAAEIRKLVQGAQDRIDIGVFYMTHKHIAGDLIAAHRRGVKVRMIVDATSAKNGYSKHELLRAAGIPVKVENWGGKMHAKSAVIDGRWVVAGSMNWTSAGTGDNDENMLIIDSKAQAGIYQKWFDTLWADVPDKWLEGRPDPESRDSGTSCSDGSDNDFDSLRDDQDPGCGANPPPMESLPPWRIVPKEEGHGLIKGNISADGKKTYHVVTGGYYANTRIDPDAGERWFCSEDEAKAAGWRRSGR